MQKILVCAFVLLSSVVSAPGGSPKGGGDAESRLSHAAPTHHTVPTGLVIVPVGPDVPRMVPAGTPAAHAPRPAPDAPRRSAAAGRRFFPLPVPVGDPVVRQLVFE